MKLQMYDFLFLDERDSPNLTELEHKTKDEIKKIQNKRHFGLCGVTLAGINYPKLNIAGRRLQERFFGKNRYEPFHYYEILNKCGKFSFLGEQKKLKSFCDSLDYFIRNIDFKIIGSFIDKPGIAMEYGIFEQGQLTKINKIKPSISPKTKPSEINLYDIALKFLLKDYYSYLKERRRKGLIIAEARGKKEDASLLTSFFRYQREGTGSLSGKEIRENIIDLLVVPKIQNHIGLQLSDILMYPFYDYFIPNHIPRKDHIIKEERFLNRIIGFNVFPTQKRSS